MAMPLSLLGLLCFLGFAPRCALSVFQSIAYSRVEQCGPFNVSFFGGTRPAALPLTLTVIPFNSTPLAFTIPDSAWNNSTSSGSFATFLPLPAGVTLMASLDDAEGNSAALTSEVFQVLPSTNTSCVSSDTAAPAPFRLVNSTVSQCLPFSVSRNTSSADPRLSTRAFVPTSLSSKLRQTALHKTQGVDTFTYIMSVVEGIYVALLFDDGQGNRQVSDLLLVGGGPTRCLQTSSALPTATPSGSEGVSRPAVIAISVTASVVVLIIVTLGVFFIRRERRKLIERVSGTVQNRRNTPLSLRLGSSSPAKPVQAELPGRAPSSPAPVDPVYPPEMFVISSTEPRRARQSARSTILAPFTPSSRSLRSTKSRTSTKSRSASTRTKGSSKGTGTRQLADLDIAGLLEAASQQVVATEAPRGYPGASPHTITPAPTPPMPSSPASLSASSHGAGNSPHAREIGHQNPDVPLSPLSRFSHEWFPLEPPSAPAAAAAVVVPRRGLSSRIRPLRAPFPSPSIFAPSKNSVI